MSNNFLSIGGINNLTDGTANIYARSMRIKNLVPNNIIKTSSTNTLITVDNINISEVAGLQTELNEINNDLKLTVSNPMIANLNMSNNDIINVKDLIFQGGLIIPSSIGVGTNRQLLTSDGKTAIWQTPPFPYIPYKTRGGTPLDPPQTVDLPLTAFTGSSYGSNTFPIGYFQTGQLIKISIRGTIQSPTGAGTTTWSIRLNATTLIAFDILTASTGANISGYVMEIFFNVTITGTNILFVNTNATYIQGKSGANPHNPECAFGVNLNSGSNLIANTLNVYFRQTVPSAVLNIYSVIYQIF
jgi:hypothetical protein